MKLAVGTRFFGKTDEDIQRLRNFIEASLSLEMSEEKLVFVAVNEDEDKTSAVAWVREHYPDVIVFPVTPWGKFVAPLNAITHKALSGGCTHLLLASAEFPPQSKLVAQLAHHMGAATLVAGARFGEHNFNPNTTMSATGTTVPWNTFAIWNLEFLGCIGFPLIADAPQEPKMAGVEEVITISILQKIYPYHQAKLVHIPGFFREWDMTGWDNARIKSHHQKIRSKNERPDWQLERVKLESALIHHIQ